MTDAERFPIQVFYSEDDEGYIAIAPDIPGSSAFGQTQELAVLELKIVIGLSLEAIQAAGNPLPSPSPPPQDEYSGKVLLRLAKSLHAKLARRAKEDGVSLNTYMNLLLAEENMRAQQHLPKVVSEDLQIFRATLDSFCLTSLVNTTSTKIAAHRLLNFGGSPRHRELENTDWTSLPANQPVIRK